MNRKTILLTLFAFASVAIQCEPPDPCNIQILTKYKENLITVENLQTTYNVGDTLWISSTLNRFQEFESSPQNIDLFSYPFDYGFGVNFVKTSVYNPEIYLCLNEQTTLFTNGTLSLTSGCNLFIYEKLNNEIKLRVGIKLLEVGNYKLSVYNIATHKETGLNCDDKGLNINTTLSNTNQQMINFTVQ